MTDTVKFTTEDEVSVPRGQRMMVSTGDWARIRRHVEKLGEPLTEHATTVASVLAGVAVTLLGVAISLEHTTPAPSESLLTGLWVACGAGALFAPVFFFIGLRERGRYRVANRAICDDMDDVAKRLGHPELGATGVATARRQRIGIKGRFLRLWRGDGPQPPPPKTQGVPPANVSSGQK